MSIDPQDHGAVERRLWDEIEKAHVGMLGLVGAGSAQHFQPMHAHLDRSAHQIWFFSYRDTDLAKAVGEGENHAMFVFQAAHFHACIGGQIVFSHDRTRIDEFWNAWAEAWYPDGKDDPRLTLLRMDCNDAVVWLSEGGITHYAWELAKAHATHRRPDAGGRTHLDFH